MKKYLLALALTVFALPTFAKGFGKFGVDQSIKKIQSVDFKSPTGEAFDLAYMTETRFVFAGVYMNDKGYVLRIRNTDKYMDLDDKMIADLQKEKVLPTPMPEYKISALDYAIGYSLWLIIAAVILWGLMKRMLSKKD